MRTKIRTTYHLVEVLGKGLTTQYTKLPGRFRSFVECYQNLIVLARVTTSRKFHIEDMDANIIARIEFTDLFKKEITQWDDQLREVRQLDSSTN